MAKFCVLLLIFLLLSLVATQNWSCPQNNNIDFIQSGLIEYASTNQRQYCQDIQLKYQISNNFVQIVASVIQIANYPFTNGADYSIKVTYKNNSKSFISTLLINQSINWKKVKASYFASSRSDLILGSFLVDSLLTLKCIKQAINGVVQFQASGVISQWKSQFSTAKQILFISGLKSFNSGAELLKISSSSINSSGILNVKIQASASIQIEFIQISYILISKNFPFEADYNLTFSEYIFPIIQQINSNNLTKSNWGVYANSLSCLGSDCKKACLTKNQCIIQKGNQTSGYCYLCQSGSIFNGINCVKNCTQNQVFNGTQCICDSKSIKSGQQCLKCPQNSIPNKQKSSCICSDTSCTWNQWKNSCTNYNCSANSQPRIYQTGFQCICNTGYYKSNGYCVLISSCPTNSTYDSLSKACICNIEGQFFYNNTCISCGINQIWDLSSYKCICKQNYIYLNNNCTLCPQFSYISADKSKCICNDGYIWSDLKFACTSPMSCKVNQILQNGKCVCNNKSILFNGSCQQCPDNSVPDTQKNVCNCNQGFYQQNNICIKNQTQLCPKNSLWNSNKYCCQCLNIGEYWIGGQCKKCGLNQEWNGNQKKCICVNGYNLIGNDCQACSINSFYNGTQCQCTLGYFYNQSNCVKCDSTCGKCSGSKNNQCLSCIDVTYNLKNGSCTKDGICPKGLYFNNVSCIPCSTYCSDCSCQSVCNTCIEGFKMNSLTYMNATASYCVQICGDGKRFQLDCDDGNNINGDGCTSDCKVQSNWTCLNGSSTKPSICIKGVPDRCVLQITGTVHLYGKIVQGARLSYIPESLSNNDCPQCYNLLWVRVIRSDIIPGIKINYLPKSQYQFLIEFQFNGAFSIPVFTIATQINPSYSQYFTKRDMAQIQITNIDPAVLAIRQAQDSLSLNDISNAKSAASTGIINQIFK